VVYILEKEPRKARDTYLRPFEATGTLIYGLEVVLLSDQLHDNTARDAALVRIKKDAASRQAGAGSKNKVAPSGAKAAAAPPTKPVGLNDCLTRLAQWMADDLANGGKGRIDLAAADRLCAAAAVPWRPTGACDQPDPQRNPQLPFNYFLGCYLDLHGRPKQAVECWKKCMVQTELMRDQYRTLAGAELCDHGVMPESYKALDAPAPVKTNKGKD